VICGKEFEKRRHGPSKYCSRECRRVFELREHHRKRAERGLPKLGDQIACERCGSDTARRSRSRPYYCEACAKARRAETWKAWRANHLAQRYEIQRVCDDRRYADPERRKKINDYHTVRLRQHRQRIKALRLQLNSSS
jgi:hypothetical protein